MLRVHANVLILAAATAAGVGPMRPSLALAGPDVVVSVVGPDLNKYGTRDLGTPGSPRLVTAYAATTTACNIGDALASWVDFNNQHPVIGQQMYRLHGGRFEQIGLSWLKHSFCAADEPSCTFLQQGSQYQPDSGDCYTLGFFANDTYSAFLNSQQFTLGPRSEVNAANGYFPYPFTLGWGQTGDCLNKRMQIANADLGPAGFPGARFFHEVHYVSADEAAGEGGVRANNASYREVLVGSLTSGPGTGGCDPAVQGHNLAFTGGTVYFKPAIHAWKTIDPDVTLVEVDVPGDGRIVVACKVVALGAGEWSYEYAVYNHNSHRCIGAVVLPKSSDPAAVISQLGFRAPAYHSGEPYSAAAWTSHVETGSLSWSTESFADNPNANAIRWGTLYNFRFHAARAPALGTLTLGLFRPAGPDEPASVRIAGIPVPVDVCRADFDGSGGVTVQDIFDFLGAYFTAQPSADINADGHIAVQDVFDFLAAWFRGC